MSKDRRRVFPVKVRQWIKQGFHPNVALDKDARDWIRHGATANEIGALA